MDNILPLNANQKYIEFILSMYDKGHNDMTLKDMRAQFKENFGFNQIMLNQYFGIMRIIPLILIKEEYKNSKEPLENDMKKIKIIRDSIAHNEFEITSEGYLFKDNKSTIKFTFEEFIEFIYTIENDFHSKKYKK